MIFESPDGGKTVYSRLPGTTERKLHWQSPEVKQSIAELSESTLWSEIHNAAKTNAALAELLEQARTLYHLTKP